MQVGSITLGNIDFVFALGKAVLLLFLIFYSLFALIIVRQVQMMSKTLVTNFSAYIRTFSIIHFLFSLGLIILAWKVL